MSDSAIDSSLEPSTINNPSYVLASALSNVAETESIGMNLTHRINQAYFRLGEAYVNFGKSTFESCPAPDSTAFHALVFGSAVVAMRAGASEQVDQTVSEAGLKKRLERARRFWFVVQCLDERVLELVDILCVSRLDKISFVRLRQMAQTLSSLTLASRVLRPEAATTHIRALNQ
ncbi:hypothetical protein BCV69DRAFT_71132 [Microstroma glucosiphilum]|uniref:Uncharacterized protein n=1 Tax=Pseudomicrostroma glucosiphilum TaxID=1684307 RepID=A0A316TYS8_9BASI|nr:hypothetical protein BCV69DRAFT_71132 [Pseudomicrostroma glucosiphilum]PWN18372.1 hypothetical protein BCV69DRAFT_71132 [Pseudomicrostroma glucosiphilum]